MTCGMVQTSFADTSDNGEYVYLHDPAVPYQYRSPHRYAYVENGAKHEYYASAIYRLLSGENNSVLNLGYCCDLQTSAQPEDNVDYYYRRVNLEDASYYSAAEARQIRRVLTEGFWINSEDVDNPEVDLTSLKERVKEHTGEDVSTLTNAEAMSATQAAVWHYSNANDEVTDFNVYIGSLSAVLSGNSSTVKDKKTVNATEYTEGSTAIFREDTNKNINAVFKYLIRSDAEGVEPSGAIWDFENDGYYVTAKESRNGVSYDITASFKMTGDKDGTSGLNLKVTPVMKNEGTEAVAPVKKTLSELTENDGVYSVKFEDVSAEQVNNISKLKFEIYGVQEVANDAYFYESKKDSSGKYLAQCFVGLSSGETKVHREWELNLSSVENSLELIKYDKDSAVKAETEEEKDALLKKGMIEVEDGTFAAYAFPVAGAKFELYAKVGEAEEGVLVGTATTGTNGKISWSVLAEAENVSFYCKEVEAPKGYILPDGDIVYNLSSDSARRYISNCHDTGSLTVEKTVKEASADEHFNFRIEIDLTEADAYDRLTDDEKRISEDEISWTGVSEEDAHHEVSWDEEGGVLTAVVKVADGESIEIKSLPVGAECMVTELDKDGNSVSEESDGSGKVSYESGVYKSADISQTVIIVKDSDDEGRIADKEVSFVNTWESKSNNENGDDGNGGGSGDNGGDNGNDDGTTDNDGDNGNGDIGGKDDNAGSGGSDGSDGSSGETDGIIQTGDSSSLAFWTMTMLLSASALLGFAFVQLKRK